MICQHLRGHDKEKGKEGRNYRKNRNRKENTKHISLTITSDVFEVS